jgi:hypothetical protein
MLDFFKQAAEPGISPRDLRHRQLRPDHPLSTSASRRSSRIQSDPAWNKPVDAALDARFQRVKAKLIGFIDPKHAVIKYPESDQSVPATMRAPMPTTSAATRTKR